MEGENGDEKLWDAFVVIRFALRDRRDELVLFVENRMRESFEVGSDGGGE